MSPNPGLAPEGAGATLAAKWGAWALLELIDALFI